MTKTAIAIRHVAFEDLGILQPLLQSAGYSVHDREAGTLVITEAGRASPLRHLGENDCVLHWHGDTFDLPKGASLLASTAVCENQAYSLGPNVLGLQFHAEFDGTEMERWLIGHACEIASVPQLQVSQLREETRRHGSRLGRLGRKVFEDWISALADS